jgi:hypothetical protein
MLLSRKGVLSGTPQIYMVIAKISLETGQFSLTICLVLFIHSRRFKRTGNRDKIFLATKFGFIQNGINGKPEYVRTAAEKSLKRLGVKAIDLYYLHASISYFVASYIVSLVH